MKTYELTDQEGRAYAFQVSNFWLDRRRVKRVIQSIPNARIVAAPTPDLASRDGDICFFEVEGQLFVVSEPYGDSDRYWIGTEPPGWSPKVEEVRAAFARTKNFLGFLRL